MIKLYEIKSTLKKIEDYDIENSKGCYNCPLAISGSTGGGGYVSCLHYGEIASWSDRGGGIDYDIDRGDGTKRLPQCEIKLGEMKDIFIKHANHRIDAIASKQLKDLQSTISYKDLLK